MQIKKEILQGLEVYNLKIWSGPSLFLLLQSRCFLKLPFRHGRNKRIVEWIGNNGKCVIWSRFSFSLFLSEHFSGASPWEEAPMLNALSHAAVRLFVLAKTYPRNPDRLRETVLHKKHTYMFFIAYSYIWQLNLNYFHSDFKNQELWTLQNIGTWENNVSGMRSVMFMDHVMVHFFTFSTVSAFPITDDPGSI